MSQRLAEAMCEFRGKAAFHRSRHMILGHSLKGQIHRDAADDYDRMANELERKLTQK